MACDSKLNILSLVAQWPGSVHDSRIFLNSSLCAKFEGNELTGLLLGGNGYPNKFYLLTPVINPQTDAERRYNSSQITTRNTVERMFGVLKRRFPCLRRGLKLKMETNLAVIVAVCTLHNYLKSRRSNDEDLDDNDNDQPDPNIHDEVNSPNLVPQDRMGTALRQAFIQRHFSN